MCLQEVSVGQRSYAATCLHSFCLGCLGQWALVKCSCPTLTSCRHTAHFLDTNITIPIGQVRSVGRPNGMKGNDKQVSSSDFSEISSSDSEKITRQKEKRNSIKKGTKNYSSIKRNNYVHSKK